MQGVRVFESARMLQRNDGILLRRQWCLYLVVLLLLLRSTFLLFVSDVVCVTIVFGRAHDAKCLSVPPHFVFICGKARTELSQSATQGLAVPRCHSC